MSSQMNQPVGPPVSYWSPPPHPSHDVLVGRYCRLEPLNVDRHADELYAANALDVEGRNWTYLPYGPFGTLTEYRVWIKELCQTTDPQFYTIVQHSSGKSAGVASYLRIAPSSGSIEVGHIHFSKLLMQSVAATESMFLMMKRAFELGYRRYEWKCDALNAASRAAAQRLGLSFEGVFRQATVYKGRNRDTAWYAAIDGDWPAINIAFDEWLEPTNFDGAGRQRVRLSDLTSPLLSHADRDMNRS